MPNMTHAQKDELLLKMAQRLEELEAASVKKNINKSGKMQIAKTDDDQRIGLEWFDGGACYATVAWQTRRGESTRKFPVALLKLLLAHADDFNKALAD